MNPANFSRSHKLVVVISDAMQRREPDNMEYWFSELDSLGIHAKRRNKINNRKKVRDLVENVKQTMLQDYHSAYTE